MKDSFTIRMLPALVIMMLLFMGCSKEDQTLTGMLQVKFDLYRPSLSASVFSIENTEVPVYTDLKPSNKNGQLTQELNIGNYILHCTSESGLYNDVGFQIRPGNTTNIRFDVNDIGKVE